MKKLLIIGFVFGFFACSNPPGYKININLEGAEGMVLLEQNLSGKLVIKDSAEFLNGTAVLNGSVGIPELHYISMKGKRDKLRLFIENSEITIEGKADSIRFAAVSGSSVQDEYKSFTEQLNKISTEYMGLYREARKLSSEGETEKADELMEQVNEMYESTKTIQEEYIKSNPASFITPVILANIQNDKTVGEMDSLLSSLDPELERSSIIQSIKERIEAKKKVEVGKTAPDFTQNDPEGNPLTFSDIYSANEYTLLDFWAAWCGPCRSENPNVVAVYNKFKDQGFTVFGVSLDRKKEDWLKAINDDGLTWQHVSELAYWDSEVAKTYAVYSIPSNFLVDKEGKILATGLRGEDLESKISELLN